MTFFQGMNHYGLCRSEIHENMNCIRCQNHEMKESCPGGIGASDCTKSTDEVCNSEQGTSDIGGFAGISGCLNKLKSSEKQVGTPQEDDLGSWGHHFFSTSVPDPIFQASAGDEVSFVFTNQVDGKLVPVESMAAQKTHEAWANKNQSSSEGPSNSKSIPSQQPFLPSILSSGDAMKNTLVESLPRVPMKSRTSLKAAANVNLKPKLSLGNQLPLKRSSPDPIGDEDFQ